MSNGVEIILNKVLLNDNNLFLPPPVAFIPPPHTIIIIDSGASNIYFAKEAPIHNYNAAAPKVHVGTATSQV